MQDYLNQLDPELIFKKTTIEGDILYIHCEKTKKVGPYVNSKKIRKIKDVNYGSYRVILLITTRKYFPWKENSRYSSDELNFLNYSKLRTQRLDNFYIESSRGQSNISAERMIGKVTNPVSDTTIGRMALKKNMK